MSQLTSRVRVGMYKRKKKKKRCGGAYASGSLSVCFDFFGDE